MLRVVLSARRNKDRRSLLNTEEVLKWCNSWKPAADSLVSNTTSGSGSRSRRMSAADVGGGDSGKQDGEVVGARCISYSFDDPLYSAALMGETDVLIGIHGEDDCEYG